MKRSLQSIKAISTSHDVGKKRVLLSANESGCSLTQIAVTDLKAGEIAQAHIHPDMQEGFYVLSGDLNVKLDDETLHCTADDFVYVKSLTSHVPRALMTPSHWNMTKVSQSHSSDIKYGKHFLAFLFDSLS